MTMTERAKNIQKDLSENANKIWLAGLGALTMAGEESGKLFKSLVEKGEKFETKEGVVGDAKRTLENTRGRASDMWYKIEDAIQDRITATLGKMGIPTRDEINELNDKVEALTKSIDKLSQSQKKAAKAS